MMVPQRNIVYDADGSDLTDKKIRGTCDNLRLNNLSRKDAEKQNLGYK